MKWIPFMIGSQSLVMSWNSCLSECAGLLMFLQNKKSFWWSDLNKIVKVHPEKRDLLQFLSNQHSSVFNYLCMFPQLAFFAHYSVNRVIIVLKMLKVTEDIELTDLKRKGKFGCIYYPRNNPQQYSRDTWKPHLRTAYVLWVLILTQVNL